MKKIIDRLNNEAGIGLVDVLVSIAILGLAVTALVTDLSAGSLAVNTGSEATTSQQLGQAQIETIKAAAFDPSGASYLPISTPAGYAIAISTNSTIYSDSNIQKITVTVSHSGATTLTIIDYKVNR